MSGVDCTKAEGCKAPAAQSDDTETSNDEDLGASPVVRVGRLDTLSDVRRELARLYRAARRAAGANPDAAVAGKLAYILQAVSRTIEGSEMEKRVIELERRLAK
jgi:hypothetical protein